MTDSPVVTNYVAGVDERLRPVVEHLMAVIEKAPCRLDIGLRWGQLTFARDGDYHHWICAIGVTRKAVALNFHFGGLLKDPAGLFRAGSSRFLRKLEYRTSDEVDDAIVLDFVSQALACLQFFKENWKRLKSGDHDSV